MLGILGVIGGPVSLFKGLDEMQQMVMNQALSASDYFCWRSLNLPPRLLPPPADFVVGESSRPCLLA